MTVWSWRSFWTAFILALCVLGMVCAFVVVDYNTRRVTYGQVDFEVTYTMQDGAPRITVGESVLTAPAADTAEGLLPPPLRLLVALWRQGNAAVEEWWARML